MSLVKCPDCGKSVSSRVDACPFCGCPSKFFIPLTDENEDEKQNQDDGSVETQSEDSNHTLPDNEGEDDETDNEDEPAEDRSISFNFAGHTLEYSYTSDEEPATFAMLFGTYLEIADKAVKELDNIYHRELMTNILKEIPAKAEKIIKATLHETTKFLYKLDINITEDELFSKYCDQYRLDYSDGYNDVVIEFAQIKHEESQLAAYRNAQKASRARWSGGGFGISGAIKGAAMAGILNAGSDFLHSFGDMDVAYNDSKIIEKELADLKKKSSTHQKLVYNIKTCVMGYFCAMVAECIDNGIPIHVYTLDYDHAESIYENTMKFEDDDDKKTDNIIQCIADFPGEKKYYDAIMDRIMQDNPSGFVEFLKFWHIDYMYDNLEKELTVRDSFDSKFDVAFKNNADLLSDITCENYIKIKDFLLKYDPNFYSHGHDNETFANESPYIPAPDISRYKKQLENFFKAFKEKKEWAETYKLALEGTGGRDYKEYFKSLHNNRFFMGYHFYIKDQICWLYGDFNDEDNKPGDSAIAKAMFDSKDTLLFFHDDSVMQFARSGIAMTTAGITELSTKKHIRYKDIRDISLVKDVKKSEASSVCVGK